MWEHYDAAAEAQDAVIKGDLQRARYAGEWLAMRGGTDPRVEGADALVNQMRQYARQASNAVDISEAAVATARMAATCGECHRMHGPGPLFRGRGVPPIEREGVDRAMQRHVWGAARLWEGLIGPSDSAWVAGARTLLDAPLAPEEITDRPADYRAVQDYQRRVRELGRQAVEASYVQQRTRLFADLISTCAGCHVLVRRS